MKNMGNVIGERLKYQSTQKKLEENFGVSINSICKIKENAFLKNFKSWTDKKQNQFFVLVGGRANFDQTKNYIKSLK